MKSLMVDGKADRSSGLILSSISPSDIPAIVIGRCVVLTNLLVDLLSLFRVSIFAKEGKDSDLDWVDPRVASCRGQRRPD